MKINICILMYSDTIVMSTTEKLLRNLIILSSREVLEHWEVNYSWSPHIEE